ncbi:hypothetical protein Tco_0374419 [Tanacetum coccineum]
MILSGGFVHFAIIAAYTPTSDSSSRNKLVLFVYHNGHSSFLWYAVDMTYPRTIFDCVNDTGIEKFDNFYLHNFFHVWVKSTLSLNDEFDIIFKVDLVFAKRWTNVRNIECFLSKSFFEIFEHGNKTDVAASFDSAVHRVHAGSFDAAVASLVSAACVAAAAYFVPAVFQSSCFEKIYLETCSSNVPADYVSAGHVLLRKVFNFKPEQSDWLADTDEKSDEQEIGKQLQLPWPKIQENFPTSYDVLRKNVVSKDVMCSYLLTSSDLDEITELQCLYLHKRFDRLEKHSISLEMLYKNVKLRLKNDTIVQLILFIVDSGCTKHMTGNVSLLCNFVDKFLGTVRFGNDQFAPILGYGDLDS